jgi:hypothetical protein
MAPTGRQWAHGVGLIVVAIALVIGIPAALLAAATSCACTMPADLIVLNYSHGDAAVNWYGPGLLGLPILGISGSAVGPACTTFAQPLRPGQVNVTLQAGRATRTVTITVPDGEARHGHSATFVVGRDGTISGPSDGSPAGGYPQDPLCS